MSEAPAPKIVARGVEKRFETLHGPVVALTGFDLEVDAGEVVCVVGPSGCGKSTFLRILAGLEEATGGSLEVRRDDPGRPENAVVFQEYAIFPWKTVHDNVAFGLRMRGVPRRERDATARHWIDRVGLTRFARAYPAQLSGGMKQRVAIARALAYDSELLLMDEPLGALDAQTRLTLQEELLRLWAETGKTVVYVTHGLEEAVLLADRVVVMTAHPGTVKTVIDVDLPRPRSIETSATPEFAALTGRLWDALRDEVARAAEAEA
jgi:NitT/TauT family transport system ATP-binding protein